MCLFAECRGPGAGEQSCQYPFTTSHVLGTGSLGWSIETHAAFPIFASHPSPPKHHQPCHSCKGLYVRNAEGSVLAARLVLVGSCRGPADQKRIDDLKSLVKDLGLEVGRCHHCLPHLLAMSAQMSGSPYLNTAVGSAVGHSLEEKAELIGHA